MGNRVCIRGWQAMRMKWLFVSILIVYMIGMAFAILVVNMKLDTVVDTVAVNELVKTMESQWDDIEHGDYSTIKQQFVVLDLNGNVRYQSAQDLSTTLNDAIKSRDTITDL